MKMKPETKLHRNLGRVYRFAVISLLCAGSFLNISYTPMKKVKMKGNSSDISIDTVYTPDNSGLLSKKVTCIFVDTFNVKWFGTDRGISRFDGTNWDSVTANDYLLNNFVNKIAYERTDYGHEMWIATAGGLSVASFDLDGVTSATTYTTDNAGILSDTVTAIGVDAVHGRWAGTKKGISIFKGSDWDTLLKFRDSNNNQHYFTSVSINGIESFNNNQQAFIATYGGGVLRYNYDDIDGFTGASTMGYPWSGFKTNNINSIRIYDTIQYFGASDGFYIHDGYSCRYNWAHYTTEEGLISNNVRAIEVDDSGAYWIGTDAGINIKKGKKWYTYITTDGLVNSVINDIRKDKDGTIWVATDGGVQYFTAIPGRQTGGFNPIQCRNVIAFNVTSNSTDLEWTIGDVGNRIVFAKTGNDGTTPLINNTTYTPNPVFGTGTEVNGWYCIYKGIGNSMTLSGLAPNTMYRVMVCEYSGTPGAEEYVTAEAVGNPANFTTMKVGINDYSNEEYTIYPNPVGSSLTIKGSLSSTAEISIYSSDGNLKMKSIHSGTETNMEVNHLTSGVYFIQIRNNQQISIYKIVKK